ncbi:MAG: hypothetical protein QGI32_24055, partial [Candidatus Latescibacteria bacterium]|nr:hypothetical protein [Candidatus Latescibacterota bacterium]
MRETDPSAGGRSFALVVFPASITMLLTACGSGDLTLNEADPDIVAQKPTWTQVEPIFQRE